jgi:hypothetical protein
MFTVFKVREGLAHGDYKDPGWYKQPPGSVAYEWKGEEPAARRAPAQPARTSPAKAASQDFKVRKPRSHGGH